MGVSFPNYYRTKEEFLEVIEGDDEIANSLKVFRSNRRWYDVHTGNFTNLEKTENQPGSMQSGSFQRQGHGVIPLSREV